MRRAVLAMALLAVVVTAGCSGPLGDGATATTTADSTAVESATTADSPRTDTTTTPVETTDAEPQKGDQFLSVMELNETEAMAWNASERAAFENLSADRQRVVREAVECDCNVELDGEFGFHDDDRIEVVEYDGTYYYLRVAIV